MQSGNARQKGYGFGIMNKLLRVSEGPVLAARPLRRSHRVHGNTHQCQQHRPVYGDRQVLRWSRRQVRIGHLSHRKTDCNVLRCFQAIDKNAEAILKSDAFLGFSDSLVSRILSRDTLSTGHGSCKCVGGHTCGGLNGGLSELTIFDRAVAWATARIRRYPTSFT